MPIEKHPEKNACENNSIINFSKTLGGGTDGYLSFSELVFKQDQLNAYSDT